MLLKVVFVGFSVFGLAHRATYRIESLTSDPEDEPSAAAETSTSKSQKKLSGDLLGPHQKVFTVQAGQIGWDVEPSTGYVKKVWEGQAKRFGAEVGMHIVKVEAQPYKYAALIKALTESQERSVPFHVTVESKSEMGKAAERAFWSMSIPAGLLSLVLVSISPFIIYRSLTNELDVSSQTLSHPGLLLIMGTAIAHGVARAGDDVLEWGYSGTGAHMVAAGDITHITSLFVGCLVNRHNPLLQVPTSKDMQRVLWKLEVVGVLLFVGHTYVKIFHLLLLRDVWSVDFIRGMAPIAESSLMLVFFLLLSRISVLARQAMLEVADALPCESIQFQERIHNPCAQVLEDIPPQLAPCGIPLLMLSFCAMISSIVLYNSFVYTWTLYKTHGFSLPDWLQLGCYVFWFAPIPLAVTVGPSQLSLALKELQDRLSEQRRSTASMHQSIRAVEEMLVKAPRVFLQRDQGFLGQKVGSALKTRVFRPICSLSFLGVCFWAPAFSWPRCWRANHDLVGEHSIAK